MKSKDLKVYASYVRQHARRFILQRLREVRKPITQSPHKPVPAAWSNERLTAAWLGHATVLINMYGTWLITDPALRPYVGVNLAGFTFGSRRLVLPALQISGLPPLDAVLVSHSHFDHCDLGTLRRLPRNAHAVVQRGNSDLLRRFERVSELSWGESVEVNGARIEAIEVNHWGARRLTDKHRGYGGFLIEKDGHAIVFGGDTAYTAAFRRLRRRITVDLAILPIGGYNPYVYVHANPEQAWAMANEMGAKYILPMHHSTFPLSREPVEEPIKRLIKFAGSQQWRIALSELGETWTLPEDKLDRLTRSEEDRCFA